MVVTLALWYTTPTYGWALFTVLPMVMGFLSGWQGVRLDPQTSFAKDCFWAINGLVGGGLAILLTGMEGLLCLLMALPLAIPPMTMGVAIGRAMAGAAASGRPVGVSQIPSAAGLALVVFLIADMKEPGPLLLTAVVTTVVVQAPPEVVWRYVTEFPPLPPPRDWLFRLGVAYPVSATIEGQGPGAIRYCHFSTGAFVEPIEIWDEPNLLHFRVDSSPPTMRELSLYDHVHAPHLSGYLESRRGQFFLERLSDGSTRLEGTTWFTNRMWPQFYWNSLAAVIIHRIHGRVLDHVRQCAESDPEALAGRKD